MQRILILALLLLALPAAGQQVKRGRLGASAENLTNTPQTLLLVMPKRTLTFCVIQGGAGPQTVIFRGVGGSPTYAGVSVAAGAVVGQAMNATIPAGGLEVVTSSPAGDVTVECTYRFGN